MDSNGENLKKKSKNVLYELTYKVIASQMKKELLKKSPKHWSEDISINKMEKISAILINYIPSLLLPAYTVLLDNKINMFSEKIALFLYYFLLCAVLLFPFIYVSGITKRKSKKKGSLLKSSDVETLSQYLLNLCMSLTLGIRSSPIPFLITSFIVLSVL